MNVLHIIPSIDLSQGGPSRTAVNLANALAAETESTIHFYTYECVTNNQLNFSPRIVQFIQKVDRGFFSKLMLKDFFRINSIIIKYNIDIMHIHGAWHPLCHWSARAATRRNIPYIVQPRGMLEPWAMQFKRLKKTIAMFLYQKLDLREASGFIATSEQEANSIRNLCRSQKITIVPNGVETAVGSVSECKNTGEKTALFMSRIHPKKGVFELVRAWGKLRPEGWSLRIVGPDDGGHLKHVKDLVRKLRLEDNVKLVGPLYGSDRAIEYSNADLFLLPTYSENFGVAVAEALSYGIPVLTTRGAPWASLLDNKCGWWIDPGEDSLINALPMALSISQAERLEMGLRAKKLAANFDWDNVAKRTSNFYAEVVSKSKNKIGNL